MFLNNGYLGTTVDEIAAVARVSKPTIYKHFGDKRRLFLEIVTGTVDEVGDAVHAAVADLAGTRDVEADLCELARRQLALVLSPRVNQAMLLGNDQLPAAAEVDRHVEGAVRVFLAAYAA